MFFSVIIPNYNHANFLQRRIESVLNQTYSNFELIILDDASTDESKLIIENYKQHPRISHVVINEVNSGSPFKQWKKGIEISKGDWIWFAESDDEAFPEFLETASVALTQHSSAGMFYCNSIYEDSAKTGAFETTAEKNNTLFASTKWNNNYFISGRDEIRNFLWKYNTILNASSAVLHKNTLTTILPKFDSINYMGDWLSYLQVASEKDIVYSCKLLNKYRRHVNSLFHKDIPAWKRKRDYFTIYSFLNNLSFLQNKNTIDRFFIFDYLDMGLKTDGFSSNYKTIKSYFEINPVLTIKVLFKIALKKMKVYK